MKISSYKLYSRIYWIYDWLFAYRIAVFYLNRIDMQYRGSIYRDLEPIIRSNIKKNCSVEMYPIKQ
jgi:hypothetical protein